MVADLPRAVIGFDGGDGILLAYELADILFQLKKVALLIVKKTHKARLGGKAAQRRYKSVEVSHSPKGGVYMGGQRKLYLQFGRVG